MYSYHFIYNFLIGIENINSKPEEKFKILLDNRRHKGNTLLSI